MALKQSTRSLLGKSALGSLTPKNHPKSASVQIDGLKECAADLFEAAIESSLYDGHPGMLESPRYHNIDYHQFGVLEHIQRTVDAAEYFVKRFVPDFVELPIIMRLHDIGKIVDQAVGVNEDGEQWLTYSGHENRSLQWIQNQGLSESIKVHVWKHGDYRTMSESEFERLFDGDSCEIVKAVFVLLCDLAGKGIAAKSRSVFEKSWQVMEALLRKHTDINPTDVRKAYDAFILQVPPAG